MSHFRTTCLLLAYPKINYRKRVRNNTSRAITSITSKLVAKLDVHAYGRLSNTQDADGDGFRSSFPLCPEWTRWSSLICFLAGRQQQQQPASAATTTRRTARAADKTACNFVRQRRILIRIPTSGLPWPNQVSRRYTKEKWGRKGRIVFVR